MYETIIIGAGIAGITAAVYASRKRMNYIILSEDFGGQVNVAGEIENYTGFAKTNWVELGENLRKQVEYNKINIIYCSVKSIIKKKDGSFVISTNDKEYATKTAIICSGARARELKVAGEKEFKGKGLTYCAICDGPLYKNKIVAVIGGGDSAMEAVDFLKEVAKKIYLITINPELAGHEYLIERTLKNKKVELITSAFTKRIKGDKLVKSFVYEQNKRQKEIKLDGVFVEIGRTPNTEFAKKLVGLDKDGHIIINKFCETKTQGLFSAGDCTDVHAYQFIISAGHGCQALLRAASYLQRKNFQE